MNVQTKELDAGNGFGAIATLEDLGTYLRGLREKRRVTQEGLSTRTGAITERKIARSRISEIENAKRDRVTERELHAYLRGLKCAPRHIDQVVALLTRCIVIPAKESPAGPDVNSPATLDVFPAGSDGITDELSPREEKPGGDPASLSQLFRHRRWLHRITFVTALAQIVMVLAALSVGFSLCGASGDRPTSPGSPAALRVPRSTPPMAGDASDLIKEAMFPDGTPVRVTQRFTATTKIPPSVRIGRMWPVTMPPQRLSPDLAAALCGTKLADQRWLVSLDVPWPC